MASLEDAIITIVDKFMEHADGDGKLSKEELKKLLNEEIKDSDVKEKLSKRPIDKLLKRKDRNGDGALDFREYWMFVGFLMNRFYSKKGGKGQEDDDEES